MRRILFFTNVVMIFLIFFVGCGNVQTTDQIHEGGLREPCYDNNTCDEGLTCVSDVCVDLNELADNDTGTNDTTENSSDPDVYDEPDENVVDENNEDGCATENIGRNCTLDVECGKCNICISGKCSKGCESDDDCRMYTGLKCNKKLARCTNVYASLQACGETLCPVGCCYAEKGFTAVKCLITPDASKCGLCANGDIYMPEDSKCIPAVCSVTTDPCMAYNSASNDPYPECFECKSGEFICKEIPSGCDSSSVVVNVANCKSAGEKCVSGPMSNCCSGLPCVDGYCY